ncbi:MAG: hypothetical protein ABIK98_08850 [Pseudomonadota bacterium]
MPPPRKTGAGFKKRLWETAELKERVKFGGGWCLFDIEGIEGAKGIMTLQDFSQGKWVQTVVVITALERIVARPV